MNKGSTILVVVYALLSASIAVDLNTDSFIVHFVYSWARIAIPICLFVGLVGAISSIRTLIAMSRGFGWMGITIFSLIVVTTAIPDETARSTGQPPASLAAVAPRALLLLALLVATAWVFRSLGESLKRKQLASNDD
jgi:hypothetical protein